MTAYNYLLITLIGLIVIGWMSRAYAEGDVVSVSSVAAKTSASSQIALASDGTPIVHKSFHKKKTQGSTAVAATMTPATNSPAIGAYVAPGVTTFTSKTAPTPKPVASQSPPVVAPPPTPPLLDSGAESGKNGSGERISPLG